MSGDPKADTRALTTAAPTGDSQSLARSHHSSESSGQHVQAATLNVVGPSDHLNATLYINSSCIRRIPIQIMAKIWSGPTLYLGNYIKLTPRPGTLILPMRRGGEMTTRIAMTDVINGEALLIQAD